MSSRSRAAMRSSRRERSTSEASAFEISFRDSSCFSQRVAASYSRAFSIATAACDDRRIVSSSSSSVNGAPSAFSVRYRLP